MNGQDLSIVNCLDPSTYRLLHTSWQQTGFVGVQGYNLRIDELSTKVMELFQRFVELPTDHFEKVVQRECSKRSGAQRGWSDSPRYFGDTFDGLRLIERKAHLMVGPRLSHEHPILALQRYGYYTQNVRISTVPGLIEAAEELYEELELLDLILFEQAEQDLGLKRGTLSSKIPYGDSFIRILHYPAVDQNKENILGYKTLDGIRVGSSAKTIDGMQALHVQNKETREQYYLVWGLPHVDLDIAATLIGAQQPGLQIQRPDKTAFPYTAAPGMLVYNAGLTAEYLTADSEQGHVVNRWIAGPHWVEIQDPTKSRNSLVRFTHARPTVSLYPLSEESDVRAQYPETTQASFLLDTLLRRQYMKPEMHTERTNGLQKMFEENPDQKLLTELTAWERINLAPNRYKAARYV